MKTAHRILALSLFAAVGIAPALAGEGPATWHVRTNGSDANCSGLVDAADPGTGTLPRPCAFRSPQKGADSAAGGDTVLIHAGTYTSAGTGIQGVTTILGLNLRSDLTSEETRLTIRKAGDGDVTFDGGNLLTTGIVIWGTSYVTIQGIEIERFTANARPAFPYGAVGVNVASTGTAASSHIVLEDLYIHDGTTTHATGQFSEIAMWCTMCESNAILSTLIESVNPVGVALGTAAGGPVGQNGTFRGNTILHTRDGQPWQGLFALFANGWTVDGNYFEESSSPNGATDYLVVSNSHEWSIVNNVFYRPPRAAIQIVDEPGGADDVENHEINNNTIECVDNDLLSPPFGIRTQRCTSCEILNNIIASCGSAVRIVGDNQNTVMGFNDLFANSSNYNVNELGFGHVLVGHDIFDDPLFTRIFPRPDPYFRLQAASPAIDAGDDDHCAGVPDAGGCDIGAFQFVDNLPPEQPSITSVDGVTGNSAVLHGSPFEDPDPGDVHVASQWQVDVLTGDFSAPVLDSGRRTGQLTSFIANNLPALTTLKSRVRYQDQDLAWSPWSDPALDLNDEFTTLEATAIAPMVIDVNPPAGAIDVVVTVTPTLTFNTPIAASSVTSSTVKLTRVTSPAMGIVSTLSLDGSQSVVTISPTAFGGLLEPSTKYKILVVEGGIKSRDGGIPGKKFTSTFTTESALQSSNPAAGATDVPVSVAPQLTFKWDVQAGTVNTSVFKLKDATSGRNVPLASVVLAGTTVTLTPVSPLKANHKHVVIAKGGANGVRFTDGRQMGAAVKVKFRTAPAAP
jgi:hypothetical protein